MQPKTPRPVPPEDTAPLRLDLTEELLPFFKAMADATRLKIVGLLATRAHSVEELARAVGLGSSTVSHHLAKLSEVGLVSARPDSYYNVYKLEAGALERLARQVLSKTRRAKAQPAGFEGSVVDRKVISDYLRPDGKLRALPAQHKKRLVILRYVLEGFERGKRYPEKKVNEVLKRFSDKEYVTLRRYLIDCKLMGREGGGGEYWRTD